MTDGPILLGGLWQEHSEFSPGLGADAVEVGLDHGLGSGHLRRHCDLGGRPVGSGKKDKEMVVCLSFLVDFRSSLMVLILSIFCFII